MRSLHAQTLPNGVRVEMGEGIDMSGDQGSLSVAGMEGAPSEVLQGTESLSENIGESPGNFCRSHSDQIRLQPRRCGRLCG